MVRRMPAHKDPLRRAYACARASCAAGRRARQARLCFVSAGPRTRPAAPLAPLQDDPELEAIRQRRMAEMMARQGGMAGGMQGGMTPEDQEEKEAQKQ